MKGEAWKARRKIKREERVINEEREREGIKKRRVYLSYRSKGETTCLHVPKFKGFIPPLIRRGFFLGIYCVKY